MRFTIRDLLWLTLLVAVAIAWWVDRSQLAAEVESYKNLTLELGVSLRDAGQVRDLIGSP